MRNDVGLALLIATAALLVWASISAWRKRNPYLKWGGAGLVALLAVSVSLVAALAIAGLHKMHGRSAPVPELKVAGTPQQIQRGRAIVDGFCSACHSPSTPLAGGL